jgi:hypothetical protein
VTYKLDIFDLLSKLNSPRSGDIYGNLSAEERKGFAPIVTLRWMSGTTDARQILLLNEFVNPYVFSLGKHHELLMRLFQVAASKTPKRYYWLAVKAKKKNTLTQKIVADYYDLSDREVSALCQLPDKDQLLKMAEELGWDKEQMSQLKKEIKDVKGKSTD